MQHRQPAHLACDDKTKPLAHSWHSIQHHLSLLALLVISSVAYADTPTPAITSLEQVNSLLDIQNKQLQTIQKNAHDVLFFSNGLPEDKTGYCKKFWHALETQSTFDIPKPAAFASSAAEKDSLFKTLHQYAENNFKHYLLQSGKLTPDKYTDVEGNVRGLGPFVKSNLKGLPSKLKELPNKFKNFWQKDNYSYGFFDKRGLIDQSLATHLLYLTPYPVAGYTYPLVLTLVKDRCEQCTGLSMELRAIQVDGLPIPEFKPGEYFSQRAYSAALSLYEANSQIKLSPDESFLLMGMGTFRGEFIFWTLQKQQWEKFVGVGGDAEGYYKPGDTKQYFRNYAVDITPLSDHGYTGPNYACSVWFN